METPLAGLPLHSRFAVRSAGGLAWATDKHGTVYRYDGLCFSRRRLRDSSFAVLPSWRTPAYGWLCAAEYPVPEPVNAMSAPLAQSASEHAAA